MAIRSTLKKKNKKNKGGIVGGAGYLLGSAAAGVAGVGEGIIDLGLAFGADISGNHKFAEYVFKDNVVGDWHEDLTEEYNPDAVWQFGGDVAHGLGQSSWFLLSLIPGAQWLGPTVFGAGMVGQGISSAAEKTGDVGVKEVAYGVTTAAIETGLETALGGTASIAKSGVKAAAKATGKQAIKSIATSAARKGLASKLFSAAAGEFAEEFVSEYADTFLQRAYQIDPNAEYSLQNALYAGAVGAVSGGISAGPVNVANTVANRAKGAKLIKNGNAQTVVNTANYVADKLAAAGTDFKKAPEWVKTLRGEVDAYNKLAAKGQQDSASAQTILGEMQASLYFAETQAIHNGIVKGIRESSEDNRAALAEYINQNIDKTKRRRDYTAADIAADTDEIATQLGIMNMAGASFYNFDAAMADMAQESGIESVIEKERGAAAERSATEEVQSDINNGEGVVRNDASVIGNVQYDLKDAITTLGEYDSVRKRHIESSENDRISRDYNEIADFINNATKHNPVKRLHIGVVNPDVANMVKAKTNIDISNCDFVIASNFIAHIFDQHGNAESEALRGQIAVDKNNIEDIIETVIQPDDVSITKDNNGAQALKFEKDINGRNVAITITSTKKSTLTLKSAWIINKNSGGHTPSANTNAFAGTSETNGRSSTNNSIHQNEPVVNTESEKNITKNDLADDVAKTAQGAQKSAEGTEVQKSGENVTEGKRTRIRSTLKKKSSESKNESSETTPSTAEAVPLPQKGGKAEPKVSEAKESLTDAQRAERAKKRAEQWIEWEKKTAPTAQELNTAREYVKGFDNVNNRRRLAILRMIRSAEGVDAQTVKGIANLMAVIPGSDLEVRFSDGIGQKGLITKVGNKTVIVIDSSTNRKNTIKGTIAHELTHYLENKAGYEQFSKFVREHAKAEAIEKHRNRYIKFWNEIGHDYTQAELDSEITASLVADALNNERFLKRYSDRDKTILQRAGAWLKTLVKRSKTEGNEEISEVADEMAHELIVLLQTKETTGERSGDTKYSFAGEKAKTADKMKLARAQEMLENGVDSETVRKETGWFKGYDGKWRFEIDDLHMDVSTAGKYTRDPEIKRYLELMNKAYFEMTATDGEIAELRRLDAEIGDKSISSGTLGDLIDHPALFKAYPELKEVKIRFEDRLGDTRGVFNPDFNEIVLSRDLKRTPKQLKKTLIHEIQHAVQHIEEFAKGSSPEYWVKARNDIEIIINELQKELDGWLAYIGYNQFVAGSRARLVAGEISFEEHVNAVEDFKKNSEYSEQIATCEDEIAKYEKQLSELNRLGDDFFATPNDMYLATAGEIEARDAANRSELNAEQRKNTRPDIDREDVVFADGFTVSYFAKDEYDEEIANIKPQLRHAQDELNAMEIVYSGRVLRKFDRKEDMKKWAKSELKQYGYEVDRQGFGKILFPERAIDDAIGHIKDQDEILSIIALFRVLKRGIQIAEHGDHKKRQKHTVTIAAPIEINGVRGNMGVVVNLTNNKYYVHRVIMPDGSSFKFDIKKDTSQEMRKGVPEGSLADATRLASTNSIPQKSDLSTPFEKKYDLADDVAEEKAEKVDVKSEEKIRAEELKAKELIEAMFQDNVRTYSVAEFTRIFDRVKNIPLEQIGELLKGNAARIRGKDLGQIARDVQLAMYKASFDGDVGATEAIRKIAEKAASIYVSQQTVFDEETKRHISLKKYIEDPEALKSYEETLAEELFKEFANAGKSLSNYRDFAFMKNKLEGFKKKYFDYKDYTEYSKRASANASDLRKLADMQKRAAADEGIRNLAKAIGSTVNSHGAIRWTKIDAVLAQISDFYNVDNAKMFGDDVTQMTLTEYAQVFDKEARSKIDRLLELRKDRVGKPLTGAEMGLWADITGALRTTINEYNGLYKDGKFFDRTKVASQLAGSIVSYYGFGAGAKYKNKFLEGLYKKGTSLKEWYFYSLIKPEVVVEGLEGYSHEATLKSFYHAIADATLLVEKMRAELIIPFEKFLDDKSNNWENDKGKSTSYRNKLVTKKVDLFGTELYLGEAIYAFELCKREHAEAGLAKGGLKIYGTDGKQRAHIPSVVKRAKEWLYNQFDATDKKYIEMVEEFFNKTSTEIKKKADYEYLGYTNVLSGHYIPIIRDRFARDGQTTDIRFSIRDVTTIYNEKFNQHITKNAKACEVINIQELVSAHARGLADYANLYMPLKSFDRLYNSVVVLDDGRTVTIREILNDVWPKSEAYFRDLFGDIQGVKRPQNDYDPINEWVKDQYNKWVPSVLSANISTILSQTSSYISAAQVISPKYLAQALAVIPTGTVELGRRADKYSKIILARSFDEGVIRAETNLDKISKPGKILGKGMEFTDRQICLLIFHAAEIQARAEGKGEVGTETNAKRAAEIADKTIQETQSMTSQAERAALQRSPNLIAQTITQFAADRIKALSYLYSSVARYVAHKKRADAGDVSYKADSKKDGKAIIRSILVITATNAWLAMMALAVRWLFNSTEDEPEEEAKQVGLDFLGNMIGTLPIISDIYSLLVEGYDFNPTAVDLINDTVNNTKDFVVYLGDLIFTDKVIERDREVKVWKNAATTVGTMIGFPMAPIIKTISGLMRRVSPSSIYWYDSALSYESYTNELEAALEKGDERLAETILEIKYKNESVGTISDAEILEIIRLYQIKDEDGKYRTEVLPGSIPDEITTKKDRAKFEKIYGDASGAVAKLINSLEYKNLTDEERIRAIKNTYKLYFNKAKTEVLGEDITSAQAYAMMLDDTSNLFLAQARKSSLVPKKDLYGKELTVKDQLTEYLAELEVEGTERLIIEYALGYKSKENKAALITYINSLNLSEKEKEQIAERLGFEIKNGRVVEKPEE